MVSAPRGTKVVGLGCHYYVLARIACDTAERFIKRSSYILSDVCDEMGLHRRSVDDKMFSDPPGVTSFATLEESCLVLHTYFEHNYSVTFDLTVDIPEKYPVRVNDEFKAAIIKAVENQTGSRPTLLVNQFFDRNTGKCAFPGGQRMLRGCFGEAATGQ